MEELLREIGLNGYESKIYLALLQYGSLDAKKISEYSLVPPTAVYPNLKSLCDRGLIQEIKGKIRSYEILPVESALEGYVRRKREDLNHLKEKLLVKSKEMFQNKVVDKKKEVVHLSEGKEISEQIYLDTLERTIKTYYVLGWAFKDAGNKYTNLRKFKEKIKKDKLDIRVIITGKGKKDFNLIKAYQEAGIKMRYSPLENFSIFISDEEVCKITLKDKSYAKRYNLQIVDLNLSKVLKNYFLQVWDNAQEINEEWFKNYREERK